jgi:hypothetical protein
MVGHTRPIGARQTSRKKWLHIEYTVWACFDCVSKCLSSRKNIGLEEAINHPSIIGSVPHDAAKKGG